ncbi:MAG: flagellar hook-basal body protein [Bacillaceae bacterium]|nr:flagellar hook-basal body protein [Bacillaceae bacterium]
MIQSMLTASVTMGQLQKKLDTISNNVANVNTNGFKRREVQFSDLLFQQVNNQTVNRQETGRNTPFGIRVGSGAKVGETSVRLEQGSIIQTGRELDVALTEKNVFFEIIPTEDGQPRQFTRDGAFYLSPNPNNNDEVFLVNGDGKYVMSEGGGRIAIPASFDSIKISDDGRINVTLNNVELTLGRLQLVQVKKPQLLKNNGDNLLSFPDLANLGLNIDDVLNILPQNQGKMIQGSLEGSNVDIGRELSEMLLAQRSYQFNARSVTMADDMLGLINNIR